MYGTGGRWLTIDGVSTREGYKAHGGPFDQTSERSSYKQNHLAIRQ